MAQPAGRALALIIGSAILGSLATLIFVDSSQEESRQTQLSRKTDPNTPPKPIWNRPPEGIGDVQEPSQSRTVEKKSQRPKKRVARQVKPTLDNPPKADQVRSDAQADVHGTPRALLEFAEALAQSMEGAFANPDARYQVSRQLISCARDSNASGSAQAARALCLANLERLKNKYPEELSAPYLSLIAELPDDLVFVAGVRPVRNSENQ